jgi:hypothetical protein
VHFACTAIQPMREGDGPCASFDLEVTQPVLRQHSCFCVSPDAAAEVVAEAAVVMGAAAVHLHLHRHPRRQRSLSVRCPPVI